MPVKYFIIRNNTNRRTVSILKQLHLTIGLIFCVINTYSQQYTADGITDSSYTEALKRLYPAQNESFLDRLETETNDRKLRRYYESGYKEIFKALNDDIKEGQMIYRPSISALLEKALLEIKTNNPIIPQDIQVLLLRDNEPNAYTIGDNYLFLNLGLFYYLESEDQVASVLSHEIAHLLLKHTLKVLRYNYERNNESFALVEDISHDRVKKAEHAFELLKNTIYKQGAIAREDEMQADSLGYIFFKNTRYQRNAFVDALNLIARYDTLRPDGLTTAVYKRFFDLPDQPFNDKWLQMEDFSSYNYGGFTTKLDKDSISSHPGIQKRVQYITGIFPELMQQGPTARADDSNSFNEIRAVARAEYLPNLFFEEQYGAAIYVSLLLLQKNPDDTLYKGWLGKGFQKIYEARRDYQLNKYLDRISPKEQTESYMQFLNFMWNLKLEEIKNIATFYNRERTGLHQ